VRPVARITQIPSHSHEWNWEDYAIYCLYGSGNFPQELRNVQFIGSGDKAFFDANDGAIITFFAAGTTYTAIVAVDQETANAMLATMPGLRDYAIILAKDLVTITGSPATNTPAVNGNPGFWVEQLFPGIGTGGQARLAEIWRWMPNDRNSIGFFAFSAFIETLAIELNIDFEDVAIPEELDEEIQPKEEPDEEPELEPEIELEEEIIEEFFEELDEEPEEE